MRGGLWAAAMLFLSCGASCGPSFEAVYEGNVRFEHCYRLDRDTVNASSHREYCWTQWVQTYTYGQSQDRVEYAKRRIRVLRGEPPPGARPDHPQEVALNATPGTSTTDAVNPQAAPAAAQSATPAVTAPNEELPGDGCATACRSTLTLCRKGCLTAPKGCAPCEPDYNSCMRRCFE
jgi:hypothetical protein